MTELRVGDALVCARYEARRRAITAVKRLLRRPVVRPLSCRVPNGRVKRLILRNGLAVKDGNPWWFYTALDRGDSDPLTNYALDYLVANCAHDSDVLVTGCGTGITAFFLADAGFTSVTGLDLLPECIAVADEVRRIGKYDGTSFVVGDALDPRLDSRYDVITALHWVFSAWMGNYGNEPASADRTGDAEFRDALLTDLLEKYSPHLNPGGRLLIELTDAVTDYRLPTDHPMGEASSSIYPVRHTPEQVSRCARANGLGVVDQKLCVSYGHHPRTLYVLERQH